MYLHSKEYEESRRLLVMAIASIKADEFQPAKSMLERILRIPSTSEQIAEAHFWLSEISQVAEDKREHLELALGYNPAHHLARKKLAILTGKLIESEIIDPDNIPSNNSVGSIISEGKRSVCGNCGGTLTYSPDGQNLVCEYCESKKRIKPGNEVSETDFVIGISTNAGHKKAVSMQSFECKACHAIFLLQPETLSLTCPYCDSIYAISTPKTSHLIPPEGIIPFAIDDRDALKILLEWLKKNRVSNRPYTESFKGIYLPVWTFDINGNIKWTGYLTQNDISIPVTGEKFVFFDDVMISATNQKPYKYKEILSEFDKENVKPYSHEYTANWLAETYTVTMSDAAIDAHSEAFREAKRNLRKEDDLNSLSNITFSSTGLIIEGFKLLLMPFWLGEYILSGQHFKVTINGYTGDIQGELPPTRIERFSNWLFKTKSN